MGRQARQKDGAHFFQRGDRPGEEGTHKSSTPEGEEQMAISMMQTGHLSGWLQGTAAFGGGMGLRRHCRDGDSLLKSNLNVTGFHSALTPESQCSKPSALLAERAGFAVVGVEGAALMHP